MRWLAVRRLIVVATVYLVRHGEPNWRSMNARAVPGAVNDLVELTPLGRAQAEIAASHLEAVQAARVVSSPMTRALQTAALIATKLSLPLSVEFDLREWVVDSSYSWIGAPAREAIDQFAAARGEWPDGQPQVWEPLSAVRDPRSVSVRPCHRR